MCNRRRTLFLAHIYLLLHIWLRLATFSLSVQSHLRRERAVSDDGIGQISFRRLD